MNIYYFTTAKHVPAHFQPYFSSFDFNLKEVDNLQEDLKKATIFLLFCPLYFNKIYISPEQIWKNYLAYHYPDITFLTAGFSSDKHSNYLDLMDLPEDFSVFLQNIQKVEDKWTPVFSGGLDMSKKIYRFYEGHGDESLVDVLQRIRRALLNVQMDVEEGMSLEAIEAEYPFQQRTTVKWKTLYSRWLNYYPLFESLPFYKDFQLLHYQITSIHPYFETNCKNDKLFKTLDCVQQLNKMEKKLILMKKYV